MKTYTVDLEGQTLELLYRIQDRILVEAEFPRADGTPGSMASMLQQHCIQGGGAIVVQAVILWAGLRHLGKEWDREKVLQAFGKLVTNAGTKGSVRDVNVAITKAVLASGVLGFSTPDEDDAGKEQPPAA